MAWQGECSESTVLEMRAGSDGSTLADRQSRQHLLINAGFRRKSRTYELTVLLERSRGKPN